MNKIIRIEAIHKGVYEEKECNGLFSAAAFRSIFGLLQRHLFLNFTQVSGFRKISLNPGPIPGEKTPKWGKVASRYRTGASTK